MAEGRMRFEWNRTAAVLAMLHNANPFREGPCREPDDFNPYKEAPTRAEPAAVKLTPAESMRLLKQVFGEAKRG